MTVGSKSELGELFTPFVTSYGPPVSTTYYAAQRLYEYSKTWNGTDSSKKTPLYEEVWVWYPGEKRARKRWLRKPKPHSLRREDHPYTATILIKRQSPYKYYNKDVYPPYRDLGYGEMLLGTSMRAFKSASHWQDNDSLNVIGKLREKIAGSDFNGGVMLAEAPKALAMIATSATRIRRSIGELRRLNPIGAAHALGVDWKGSGKVTLKRNDVPNFWLELQYGWLPLLKDVEGSAQLLAKLYNFPLVQSYRVRAKKTLVSDVTPFYGSGGADAWVHRGFNQRQIIARLTEVNVPQLVGLTDPASVAWELLPYSFVVDWFIPVGNYLSARGLAQALTGSFITTHTEKKWFVQTAMGYDKRNTRMVQQPFVSSASISVTRTVSTSLSVPKPGFKPLAQVPSWRRAANAVALLLQLKR